MAKIQDISVPQFQFTEGAAQDTPMSGVIKVYAKTDGKLYFKNDTGAEAPVGAGTIEIVLDTTPQLGGELDQNSHTIGGAEYDNGNSGTTKTIDWKLGNHQKVTMTDNCIFTFTAPTKPCMLSLRIIQGSTGSRTITLPTIKWSGGIPTWTTTANAIDILSLYYDSVNYYGQAGLAFA